MWALNGTHVATLSSHTSPVVAMCANHSLLVSSTSLGQISAWKTDDSNNVPCSMIQLFDTAVLSVYIAPDLSNIVITSNGSVIVWSPNVLHFDQGVFSQPSPANSWKELLNSMSTLSEQVCEWISLQFFFFFLKGCYSAVIDLMSYFFKKHTHTHFFFLIPFLCL